jgi:CheY-like chemotaxis protein
MQFQYRHLNRLKYPTHHILVCEDDLTNQYAMVQKLLSMFEPQGTVQISVVPGGLAAAAIIHFCKVDLILLDHDMPEGNGADLLGWMKEENKKIPVITFSGILENNIIMMGLGATHQFMKGDVLTGAADELIKGYLNG